jgi:hypothetical protein
MLIVHVPVPNNVLRERTPGTTETAVSELSAELLLRRISGFAESTLPALNVACRDGGMLLEEWLERVDNVLEGLESVGAPELKAQASNVQRDIGLIVASAERHAQALGRVPGWVVGRLPGAEQALLTAAGEERVPVLTGEQYWETNAEEPARSFTGESHELFFISAVRTQLALRAVVNTQLRNLLDGGWSPATAEGSHLLRAAAAAMREAHLQYQDFRRGPDGRPLMTPKQFNEMRAWLVSTVIGGRQYSGANAAYLGEMVVTDFLLGTASEAYVTYVESFSEYQSPRARRQVAEDRRRTSLMSVLARELGLASDAFDQVLPADLVARIRLAPPSLRQSLWAFKDLMSEYVNSSGAHIGLIHVYLEKYESSLDEETLAAMPVRPSYGTGGHSHGHTRQLHDMRRSSPAIRKLLAAISETKREGEEK